MSTLKLDELIVGAGLTLKRTATGVYKFFKTSSTNVVNTPIEMNDTGLILDNPLALVSPAQLDRSTKLATMEALGKELGNFSPIGGNITTSTYNLTLNDAGKIFTSEVGTLTLNIPNCTTVPSGTTFYLRKRIGANSNITIKDSNNNTLTTITSTEVGLFYVIHAGSNTFIIQRLDDVLPRSLSTNGYQRLPSGLILQWGQVLFSGNGSFNFPIAFPNSTLTVNSTIGPEGTTGDITTPLIITGYNNTICNLFCATGSVNNYTIWAIGY